jgi:hypothetical protein
MQQFSNSLNDGSVMLEREGRNKADFISAPIFLLQKYLYDNEYYTNNSGRGQTDVGMGVAGSTASLEIYYSRDCACEEPGVGVVFLCWNHGDCRR